MTTSSHRSPTVLTREDVLTRLKAAYETAPQQEMFAFYSSVVNGIATDPSLFVLPIDDHMAHRGHAVFDTCNVSRGKAYGLTFHLKRLLRSAADARIIAIPNAASSPAKKQRNGNNDNDNPHRSPDFTDLETLRSIVLRTIAASKKRDDVYVRMWMSVGRGDFSILPSNCKGVNFYVVVHAYSTMAREKEKREGICEVTVSIPLKPQMLATLKSNNYMVNALVAMEAKEKGGSLGLQLDSKGNAAETSIGSVGFVGKDGVLRTPKQELILRGTSVIRSSELWSTDEACKAVLKGFEFTDCDARVMDEAVEILGFGGGHVTPIVKFNGRVVGDGRPGRVFQALNAALTKDTQESEYVDEIPYDE